MDCFQKDGVDNHQLVERMQRAIEEYVDAYMDLSEPIQRWFDNEYRMHNGTPCGLMAMHLDTATYKLAIQLGVEGPLDYGRLENMGSC